MATKLFLLLLASFCLCWDGVYGQEEERPTLEKVHLGGRYYMVSRQTLRRREAFMLCEARGMHLVTVDTDEKHRLLMDWLLDHDGYANEGFWTGGVRMGGTGRWRWRRTAVEIASDDPRWLTGQPDELVDQQSVLTFRGGTDGWIDMPADQDDNFLYLYALCEF